MDQLNTHDVLNMIGEPVMVTGTPMDGSPPTVGFGRLMFYVIRPDLTRVGLDRTVLEFDNLVVINIARLTQGDKEQ